MQESLTNLQVMIPLKSKFKKIVKELHPDTVGLNEENKEKLTKVLEAYKIIKDQHDSNRKPNSK